MELSLPDDRTALRGFGGGRRGPDWTFPFFEEIKLRAERAPCFPFALLRLSADAGAIRNAMNGALRAIPLSGGFAVRPPADLPTERSE